MSSNYNHFFQQIFGNFEDSDEIESSQESEKSSKSSQSSEGIEASQEKEAHIDLWPRIQNEVFNRNKTQHEALTNQYEQHEDSSEVASI